MKNYSDEFWYMHILDKDSVGKQLNLEEKSTIIKYSMQEAERQLKTAGRSAWKADCKGISGLFWFSYRNRKTGTYAFFSLYGNDGSRRKESPVK